MRAREGEGQSSAAGSGGAMVRQSAVGGYAEGKRGYRLRKGGASVDGRGPGSDGGRSVVAGKEGDGSIHSGDGNVERRY